MISAIRMNRQALSLSKRALSTAEGGKTVVYKYGGTSVGNADALRRVGAIMSESLDQGNRPVAVLSAMYSVTNRLLRCKEAAASGDEAALASAREGIWQQHVKAIGDLTTGARAEETMETVDWMLRTYLDTTAREVLESGEATTYQSDVMASLGERMSVVCLAAHLQERGYISAAIQADEVIVTDGVSGNSMPLLDRTADRVARVVQPVLNAGGIPIVTGFFGAGEDGKLTTLGRGGSDLTAATLGYCLDADAVSLFKVEHSEDENGFMKGWEPGFVGVVHDANLSETVEALNYSDARELAHFGKSVLHPATVAPAVEKNIPVYVKNTFEPSLDGTVIKSMPAPEKTSVVNALTKISVDKYMATHGVKFDSLVEESPADNTLVVMVGDDVCRHAPELEVASRQVLAEAGIPTVVPQRVNGSRDNFSVVVPAGSANQAVSMLHAQFVAKPVVNVLESLSVLDAQASLDTFQAGVASSVARAQTRSADVPVEATA